MFNFFKKSDDSSSKVVKGGKWRMSAVFPNGGVDKRVITSWKRTGKETAEAIDESGKKLTFIKAKFVFEEI